MLREQADDGHHEPRRAEPALQAVAFVERLLHGMQRGLVAGEAFDGRHLMTLGLDREHQARPHRRTVQQNRAAATYAVLAADVRPGQAEIVAEMVREEAARIGRPRLRPRSRDARRGRSSCARVPSWCR